MGRPGKVVLVVTSAATTGQIARFGALAPLLLAGLLVAASIVALRWREWRLTARSLAPSRFVTPLATSWLVVILLPVHKLSHRGVSASGPTLSVESLIEVVAFAAAALVALGVVRALEPTLAGSRPPMLLFMFPVWTAASGVWGSTGPYAVVRGGQLAVTALLAWATIALARTEVAAFAQVIERVLRWFVRVTVVLVVLGLAFGPVYVSASEANLDRFTWIGAHPLAAGLILSVATVIVLALPLQLLRMRPWVRGVTAVGFVGALVPNHSRQSWLGLAVVFVVALALSGRLTPLFRWVGAPLVGAAAVAGVWLRGPQVWDYLLRNEDSQSLSTGNGRLGLWSIGYRALETPFDWLFGLGHGITRTVFVADEPWARSAHSSFLAVLVSEGVVGMVVFLATILVTAANVVLARLWARSASGFTLTLLLVLVLINGLVSDNLAEPNLGFAMLYLIAAVAAAQRSVGATDALEAEIAHVDVPSRVVGHLGASARALGR